MRASDSPATAPIAAEPRGVDEVRARGLEIAGEQLGLAEHGGGERLAAAGARLLGLCAQALGEAGDAVVGVARREHVLGHAQVGVEDAARELRRIPDVRSAGAGNAAPSRRRGGRPCPQEGQVAGIGGETGRLGGHRGAPVPIAGVPGHHAAQQHRLTEVFGRSASHRLERSVGARDVTRREAGARLLRAQRRDALGGAASIASA